MSEETKKRIIPVETIEDNIKITLEFDNNLHKRLQNLIFHALPFKDLDHLLKVCKQVKEEDFKSDPLADHLYTILYLIGKFEEAAKKEGKVSIKNFDLESKSVIEEDSKKNVN